MIQTETAITGWIEAAIDGGQDIPAPSRIEGLRAADLEFDGWLRALVKVNGRAAIPPEMAPRIKAWLGVECGGEARLWLVEQSAYDLWQAEQRFKAAPMHVRPAPLAA